MVGLGNVVGDVCIQDVVHRWNISRRSEIFVCIVKGEEKGLIEIRCVFDRKLLEFLLMFT